jgi:ATP-dependent Clp protease protease subunit
MLRAKAMLDEITESIINAYEIKTGMSRAKILRLMQGETWMNARKAIELGFADGMWMREEPDLYDLPPEMFNRASVMNSLIGKLPQKPGGVPIGTLDKRLELIKNRG